MFIKALSLFCIFALTGCPAQEWEKPAASFSFSLDGETFSSEILSIRDEHPRCRVLAGPEQGDLEPILRKCDRIQAVGPLVVTFGDGVAKEERAGPIWEEDPPRVAEILGKIRVVESLDTIPYFCGCGSNHSILELFSGRKRLAQLHLHHGFSIAWVGGPWTGLAALTRESQEFLIDWLDSRGIPGPKQAREESLHRGRVHRELRRVRRTIMPQADWSGTDRNEHRAAQNILTRVLDPRERTRFALRLLGCVEVEWVGRDMFDHQVREVLDALSRAPAFIDFVTSCLEEPLVARGLASWILDRDRWKELEPDAIASWLPSIAAEGLRSPLAVNRRLTLAMLDVVQGEPATRILCKLLANEIEVRKVSTKTLPREAGLRFFFPKESLFLRVCSDRALAALILAACHVKKSLPMIESILREDQSGLSAEDKRAFTEAATLLRSDK